ncbi:hypothetical protein [Polyangium mundeleinium]|uniref:Uncharacterized protein n=1 Tax=Polyangium mundeleinium TaxID=2995306 RepID=A0ABT5EH57_9BACT|nr:hypothetical protein [Polyangium mundeleinium]MDC0741096.1 hypothetical protein [Polyangium mundeleinium]
MLRKLEPEEIAFIERMNAVYLSEELDFEEAVREYRQIEAEFVERAGDNEYHVVETRRRITEWILSEALRDEQPHEVCREIWHELLQRGFSGIEKRHSMSGIYARCCQLNGEFEAGLAVIEPLIAEAEQGLADPTLPPNPRAFYEQELAIDRKIRDELKAGIRSLMQRIEAVYFSDEMSFEEAVREYRRIEEEFVERAGDNEADVVETRRRITEWLLDHALEKEQPHEVCREIWHELLQRGFSRIEERHRSSRIYARCCQMNGEFDAGLAVIEPLIAEAEQELEDAALPDPHAFYEHELEKHREIRDELKAGIRG